MHHFQRQPLTVSDICEDDCGLCATLGCLRPEPLGWETFLSELDQIQLASPDGIVFPPNAISHPDLVSMIREIRNRGLEAIVRLRPRQIVRHRDMIATLEYREAKFEILFDRPLEGGDLENVSSLGSHVVASTVVMNRSIDTEALVETISRASLGSVALLAPVENGPRFFSPDAIYRLKSSATLRDLPSAGMDQGQSRFFETGVRATPVVVGKANVAVRVSVIIPFHHGRSLESLDSLDAQILDRSLFEIVVVSDRAPAADMEAMENWIRSSPGDLTISLYSLDETGTSKFDFRAGLARNAGAYRARGDVLVFLDADAVAPSELLRDALEAHDVADVVQYERVDSRVESEEYWTRFYEHGDWMSIDRKWKYVSSFALSLKLAHFLAAGGFPAALNRYGCEDTFLGWKLDRMGLRFELRPLEVGHVGVVRAKRQTTRSKMKRIAESARAFYLCTLDPSVYRLFFPVLGRFPDLRWVLRAAVGAST